MDERLQIEYVTMTATNRAAEPDGPAEAFPRLSRRQLLRRSAIVGLLAGVPASIYAHEVEPEKIRLTEIDVAVPSLPPALHGFRIGHLSDTHCDNERAISRARRAARLLASRKPDAVFLTGDYISHAPLKNMAPAANALKFLASARKGVYAVLGNHDWWSGDPDLVARELDQTGFHVLRNQSLNIAGTDLWLVGLDQRCDGRQDPERALEAVPRSALKLLLIHEPDYADEAPRGFALQFSGHSHGGQVRLPPLPPPILPIYGRKYPEGLQQALNHRVFTTRGVGMIGPRFRLFCPPEVAVIRLVRALPAERE